MSIVYRAEIHPTKRELLTRWVAGQPWFQGMDGTPVTQIGSYRFDDPAGHVGIETHILRAGDQILQVPLTYRAMRLTDPSSQLITTMTHSVLGQRWIYDGCTDPVYLAVTARAALRGLEQSPMYREAAGVQEYLPATVTVRGTGQQVTRVEVPRTVAVSQREAVTTIRAGALSLSVHHLPQPLAADQPHADALIGHWEEQCVDHLLAEVHRGTPTRSAG